MFKSARLHKFLSLFEKETNSFLLKYKISDISIFFGRLCLIDFKTLFLEKIHPYYHLIFRQMKLSKYSHL